MKSSTATIVAALRVLSRDIVCEDGVATAAIAEAADRLEELTLTDAEREAVTKSERWARLEGFDDDAATLRGLLERHSGKLSDSDNLANFD